MNTFNSDGLRRLAAEVFDRDMTMRYSREAVEQTYTFTHRSGRKFTITACYLEDAVNQYRRQVGGDDYMCVEVRR